MVTALAVQHLQGLDRLLKGLPLSGFADLVVIEGKGRVVAVLYGLGDIAHQGVECLGALYEPDGKDQLRVLFVFHLDRDVVLGEHVPGAEPELERVSEIDGRGDR